MTQKSRKYTEALKRTQTGEKANDRKPRYTFARIVVTSSAMLSVEFYLQHLFTYQFPKYKDMGGTCRFYACYSRGIAK